MDIHKIIKEEIDDFTWMRNLNSDDIFDVCDLVKIDRDIVGKEIKLLGKPNDTTKTSLGIVVPRGVPSTTTKLLNITEPWNDNVKIWVKYKGELKGYGCGHKFKII